MKRTGFVVAVFLIGIIVILGGWLLGIIGRDDGRTLGERLDAAYHAICLCRERSHYISGN